MTSTGDLSDDQTMVHVCGAARSGARTRAAGRAERGPLIKLEDCSAIARHAGQGDAPGSYERRPLPCHPDPGDGTELAYVAGASGRVPVCPVIVRRAVTQTVTRAVDLARGLTLLVAKVATA
jgi:hypothetical protein